jgi:hypothetical protein
MLTLSMSAQVDNQTPAKKHRLSIYAGIGPNYYFNNLVINKEQLQPWNKSLALRIIWEPQHFISLGLESGYYQLYTYEYTAQNLGPAMVTNIAIPIQLVASMKFLKNYYANASVGQSYLVNQFTSSEQGKFNSASWSLADYGITAGYKYRLSNRISLCAEAKFFHAAKFNDNNMAIVFLAGFKL